MHSYRIGGMHLVFGVDARGTRPVGRVHCFWPPDVPSTPAYPWPVFGRAEVLRLPFYRICDLSDVRLDGPPHTFPMT